MKKNKVHRGSRKVKFEISQALVMKYVKFNVHSSYEKQVLVLIVADRLTDAPGDLIKTFSPATTTDGHYKSGVQLAIPQYILYIKVTQMHKT